jgi:hypothetical protein
MTRGSTFGISSASRSETSRLRLPSLADSSSAEDEEDEGRSRRDPEGKGAELTLFSSFPFLRQRVDGFAVKALFRGLVLASLFTLL